MNALQSLPELWLSKKLSVQERKEILRCIIDKVFINTKGKVLKVEILWQGGKITKVNVPKYIYTSNNIYYRIVELSAKKTDGEIAEILNKEGILTIKNKPWTVRRVMDFRLSNAIPSTFTTSSKLRLLNGYVTSREATKYLGVNVSTIQRWVKEGILTSQNQTSKQSQLWIYLDAEIKKRLDGTAEFDATIKTVSSIMKLKNMNRKEVIEWANKNNHTILRLRRGKRAHFYVRPKNFK